MTVTKQYKYWMDPDLHRQLKTMAANREYEEGRKVWPSQCLNDILSDFFRYYQEERRKKGLD